MQVAANTPLEPEQGLVAIKAKSSPGLVSPTTALSPSKAPANAVDWNDDEDCNSDQGAGDDGDDDGDASAGIETCGPIDWSATSPCEGYSYCGECFYYPNLSARCFLCHSALKYAHVVTMVPPSPPTATKLVGAQCLEQLVARGNVKNQAVISPTQRNTMFKQFEGAWTHARGNALSLCKTFRAGQRVEIRCGTSRSDASSSWAGYRVVGPGARTRSLTFFDDRRFPLQHQICAVAFAAPQLSPRAPKPKRRRRWWSRPTLRHAPY